MKKELTYPNLKNILKGKFRILLLSLVILSIFQLPALAKTSTSDCVVVKVGNPQGEPKYPSNCEKSGYQGSSTTSSLEYSTIGEKAVALARQQIVKTYVWGGCHVEDLSKYPDGCAHYDCSGLTRWSWYWASDGKVNDLYDTHTNWDLKKGNFERFGPAQMDKLQPGDLVYFGDIVRDDASHTGIYAGVGSCGADDCFVEEYRSGLPGRENSLAKRKGFLGFLRPVIK